MKIYKHYSFDLWQTLIKSNPDFKLKRAEYFFKHFNRKNRTIEEVQSIIRDIDIMCNVTNEVVGANIHAFEMYVMVLHKLEYDLSILSARDVQSIYHIVDKMFNDNPPVVYDSNTISVLKKLKSQGATLNILSNTAFIHGNTLKKFIDSNFKDIFLFQLYSDETGTSKPNVRMFTAMINMVFGFRISDPITLQDILHVGDNLKADILGADAMKIDSFQINSNDKSIIHLI